MVLSDRQLNEHDLDTKIVRIYKDAEFPLDRLDVGITLMKMSDGQVQDLLAMVDYFMGKEDAGFVAAQIGHDLGGLKNEFINGPCGFSPRSTGFAKKVS